LVPLLRLKEGLLQNVSLPFAEPSSKMLKSASTQKGLRKWGTKLITLDENNDGHHIDMIILGSVAVDKRGNCWVSTISLIRMCLCMYVFIFMSIRLQNWDWRWIL